MPNQMIPVQCTNAGGHKFYFGFIKFKAGSCSKTFKSFIFKVNGSTHSILTPRLLHAYSTLTPRLLRDMLPR